MVTLVAAPAKGSSLLKRRYVVPANLTEGVAAEIYARPRLIVGISGASGVIYGARLLELLRPLPVETHLVISRTADVTLAVETDLKPAEIRARADVVHSNSDMAAPISSGSFKTIGMVVAPCSIRSMAEIASGVTTTLLSRAADVVLKERRRLVLLVRETPLHTGHLRTMTALSEMGAVIAPPVPAFYAKPKTLDEMIDQTLGRVLDLFDLETGLVRRWGEPLIEDGRPLRSKPRRRKV
jgi:flavin prenyltransferase